ncbi:type II toxin-antitoxin system VapC family toxin [Methyloglobulus sp.]|uniref:type II toxin-antitoxin system VapC family toxin n=1 Tax=Methyloglobulus sp. TaxID=2518622 RepID=UPI0032B78632
MRLLLDTQIALWGLTNDRRLTSKAQKLILEPENDIFISVASLWEISIKYSLGRGDMPVSGSRAYELFMAAGYQILVIQAAHTIAVESLPTIHNDPFDRMLVAQALSEPMRLVTHDRVVAGYNDSIIFV